MDNLIWSSKFGVPKFYIFL